MFIKILKRPVDEYQEIQREANDFTSKVLAEGGILGTPQFFTLTRPSFVSRGQEWDEEQMMETKAEILLFLHYELIGQDTPLQEPVPASGNREEVRREILTV